jgi:hypothetical protein
MTTNATFKLFADKMGGTLANNYIGTTGDIFYDPDQGVLKISDGVTAGGNTIFNVTPTYGQFWSNTSQTVASANTEYRFVFNNSDASNNIQLGTGAANSRIIINQTGRYNIQFSVQVDKALGGGTTAKSTIWFKKNGTNVSDSGGFVTLDQNLQVVQSWNILANVTSGDYYEIAYAASSTVFSFPTIPADVVIGSPASPSIIVTVTPVGAGA